MSKNVARVGTGDSILSSDTVGPSLRSILCMSLNELSLLTWSLLRIIVWTREFITSTPLGVSVSWVGVDVSASGFWQELEFGGRGFFPGMPTGRGFMVIVNERGANVEIQQELK